MYFSDSDAALLEFTPMTSGFPCRLNAFTISLVMPETMALVVEVGLPYIVTFTRCPFSKEAENPEGITTPSDDECDERYCVKFTSVETEDTFIAEVPFRAPTKAVDTGPESWFWT